MVNSVMNPWCKAYVFLGCGLSLWLLSQAPIGKWGKGLFLSLSLVNSLALVRLSLNLIPIENRQIEDLAMEKERRLTELALQTSQAEREMEAVYGASIPPEALQELKSSLDALWEFVADSPSENDLLTRKNLYLEVSKLMESGMSQTDIIQDYLGFRGAQYRKGKELLQQLLAEGDQLGWNRQD